MKNQLLIASVLVMSAIQVQAEEGVDADDMNEPAAIEAPVEAQPAPVVEAQPAPAPPAPEAAPQLVGAVARSAVTSAVEAREPVDNLERVENTTNKVYFFTELKDMNGQTATHRWTYNGEVMAEVKFNVAGSRWRIFSSKNMMPEWTGNWTVEVLNADGEVISTDRFDYVPATEVASSRLDSAPALEPTDAPEAMDAPEDADDDEAGAAE